MSVTLAMRRLFVPLVLAMLTMLTMLGCVADPSANLEPEPIDARAYGWATEIGELPPSTTLETRFPAPVGHARAKVDASSFAGWLRGLPVRLDRRSVLDHRGRKRAWNSAGVITLDVGTKDLQQCADTLLRLHGEWLWSQGRTRELAYHFTSGDLSRFSDWIAGRRLQVDGATVRTIDAESVPSDRAALRMWFEQLFMYAGTRSLELDTEPVPLDRPIAAGDMLLRPGSPGHVVMVLDVAEAPNGDQLAVIGQGSMPAQEFHVIAGPIDGAWFPFPSGEDVSVDVPGWGSLSRSSARRFNAR